MKPIRLLWLVLAVALAWGLWWAWGAWSTYRNLTAWLEERRAEGWQAEWSDLSVQGFPTRLDTTITDLTLANTQEGWVWNTPFLQILGLNYDDNHYVVVWANEMSLQTPYEQVAISGEDFRGSVGFVPGRARQLEEGVLVFKGVEMQSDAGWSTTVDELRLATRPTETREGWQDIGLEISGLKPVSPALERLSNMGLVPGRIERLNADLAVRFDRAWDRAALETARPQPREIDIRDLGARWGQLELQVAGDLTVDDTGQVSGEIAVKATNWQDILELLRNSETVPSGVSDALASAARVISGLAGRSDTLDIPVTFSGGRTRVGIVPLGPAPVIRIP